MTNIFPYTLTIATDSFVTLIVTMEERGFISFINLYSRPLVSVFCLFVKAYFTTKKILNGLMLLLCCGNKILYKLEIYTNMNGSQQKENKHILEKRFPNIFKTINRRREKYFS